MAIYWIRQKISYMNLQLSKAAKQWLKAWSNLCRFMHDRVWTVLSLEVIVSFLAKRFYIGGISASIMQSFRTAFCTIVEVITGKSSGNHPLIMRSIRASNNCDWWRQKYSIMWDAKIMWDYYLLKERNWK